MLAEVQTSTGTSFIKEIRHLLTSQDLNGLYLFITSLSSVDPKLWAGTSPDIPPVLEEWEVERVMKLLESEDKAIRKQVSSSPILLRKCHLMLLSLDPTNAMACRPRHRRVLLCTGATRRFASDTYARNRRQSTPAPRNPRYHMWRQWRGICASAQKRAPNRRRTWSSEQASSAPGGG